MTYRHGRSAAAAAWRNLYATVRWRALRLAQLRAEPLCRFCAGSGRLEPADTVDHIVPHKGDPALFYDARNLQSLCAACHSGPKQRAERRGFDSSVGDDGWPTDPAHPANRCG